MLALLQGNPQPMYQQLASQNPQFAQTIRQVAASPEFASFAKENHGLTPQQILSRYGRAQNQGGAVWPKR